MFWVDRIAGEIESHFAKASRDKKPLVIRDEKTVSGRVHVGSMRGVAIHGVVSEALAERGVQNTFTYELNDFDVFDTAQEYLPREFEQYIGRLVKDVPSPAVPSEALAKEGAATNFAEYFGKEFKKVITDTGWTPEFYWGSELYMSGKMDEAIRQALENAEAIRRIYKEVSGSQKEEGWLPISIICERCKKITTTQAKKFDGKLVRYSCSCGYEGSVSPFGGNAKLLWKVEWPAKWKVLGVKVEGSGKDHSTKGGARDVANHIAKEVFGYEPPFDIPYEFFLVGGKKMSSSRGRGSDAKEIAELVPPKIFRLALLGKEINQAFNFDPEGDTIPVLYDQYDKLAENFKVGIKDDYARLFKFLHPGRDTPAPSSLPRFSQVAFVVQMPHLNLEREFPEANRSELEERAAYAKKWLERYAPEKYVFKLQETMPAVQLSEKQKTALATLADYIESEKKVSGEQLHHRLHEIKEEQNIAPAELFGAIYLIFLGKRQGPQAGWFLGALPHAFVLKRLREAVL